MRPAADRPRRVVQTLRVVGLTLVLCVLSATVLHASGAAQADDSGTVMQGLIGAGDAHTCAVLDAGSVRCWGRGADGRLGYGDDRDVGDGSGPSIEQAGDVPVGAPVRAVSLGSADTCALLDSGAIRCWGAGGDDRLGYGGASGVGGESEPSIEQAGDVPLSGHATAVAAGTAHTCALMVGGSVQCWGDGAEPHAVADVEQGIVVAAGGSQTCVVTGSGLVQCWSGSRAPAVVPLSTDDPAIDIAVGSSHACAVLGSGAVTCWSFDDAGTADAPSEVTLAAGAIAVAAGGDRSCALLDGGAVECWDAGGSPDGVAVAGGATALAVGPDHACVLLSSGLSCWGSGADGRLGYGDTDTRATPVSAERAASPTSAAASPGAQVTFGGGTQADGSRAQPPRIPGSGDDEWSSWWAALLLPVAAAVGWVLWRRHRALRAST